MGNGLVVGKILKFFLDVPEIFPGSAGFLKIFCGN